jgi:sialidase-1
MTFAISSNDDGKTWTEPIDLTSVVKRPGIRSDASGPGIGIELKRGVHAGRFVFPLNEGAGGHYTDFSVYSDDQGKTWRRSTPMPKSAGTEPNECQLVELRDGTLMMNARNQARDKFRLVSRSTDGGESWSVAELDKKLPDPTCMGSIVRLPNKPDLFFFSNPSSSIRRAHGTMRISGNEGKTWTTAKELTGPDSSFEYSCLCPLSKNDVAILFETREISPSGKEGYRIKFRVFSLKHG